MMVTLISISIDQHMSKPVHLLPPSPRTLLGGTDSRAATGRTLDQELEKYSDSRNNLLKFQSTQYTAQELGNKTVFSAPIPRPTEKNIFVYVFAIIVVVNDRHISVFINSVSNFTPFVSVPFVARPQ